MRADGEGPWGAGTFSGRCRCAGGMGDASCTSSALLNKAHHIRTAQLTLSAVVAQRRCRRSPPWGMYSKPTLLPPRTRSNSRMHSGHALGARTRKPLSGYTHGARARGEHSGGALRAGTSGAHSFVVDLGRKPRQRSSQQRTGREALVARFRRNPSPDGYSSPGCTHRVRTCAKCLPRVRATSVWRACPECAPSSAPSSFEGLPNTYRSCVLVCVRRSPLWQCWPSSGRPQSFEVQSVC